MTERIKIKLTCLNKWYSAQLDYFINENLILEMCLSITISFVKAFQSEHGLSGRKQKKLQCNTAIHQYTLPNESYNMDFVKLPMIPVVNWTSNEIVSKAVEF